MKSKFNKVGIKQSKISKIRILIITIICVVIILISSAVYYIKYYKNDNGIEKNYIINFRFKDYENEITLEVINNEIYLNKKKQQNINLSSQININEEVYSLYELDKKSEFEISNEEDKYNIEENLGESVFNGNYKGLLNEKILSGYKLKVSIETNSYSEYYLIDNTGESIYRLLSFSEYPNRFFYNKFIGVTIPTLEDFIN